LESTKTNPFNHIIFKANGSDENEIIQNALFEIGCHWSYMNKKVVKEFKEYPMFLFVDLKDKELTYSDRPESGSYNIHSYIKGCNVDGENICPTIFNIHDVKYINQILLNGNIRPEYGKRKIIKESTDNEFEKFAFLLKSEEESVTIQKLLFKNGYKWRGEGKDHYKFNNFPVIVYCYILDDYIDITFQRYSEATAELIRSNNKLGCYPVLYDMDKYEEYERNIRLRKLSILPNYTKRNIIKESTDTKEIFKVAFYLTNQEDSEIIQNLLFENGYGWAGERLTPTTIRHCDYPILFFINFNNDKITQTDLVHMTNTIKSGKYSNCHNIIYDMNSLTEFLRIAKSKDITPKPNYNKRDIKPYLESVNDGVHKIAFSVKNEEESIILQEELFECGYIWAGNPNKITEVHILNHNYYPLLIFVTFDTNRITWTNDSGISQSIISKGFKGYHHIIYNMDNFDEYLRIVKSKNIITPPNYKSNTKKIKSIDDYLNEGKLDSFNKNFKYKVFIIMVQNEDELDIVNKLLLEYDFDVITMEMITDTYKIFPLGLLITKNTNLVCFWSEMTKANIKELDAIEGGGVYETPFTIDDLTKVKGLLDSGFSEPNYGSKKIIRESVNWEEKTELFRTRFSHDNFVVIVNDDEELNEINNLLMKFGFYNFEKTDIEGYDEEEDNMYMFYPLALYVHKDYEYIGHIHNITEEDVEKFIVKAYDVYDKPFTINDLRMIETILKTGQISPSYNRKEIVKESKEYNYGSIILHARNNSEVKELQYKLFKEGFRWGGDTDRNLMRPNDNQMVIYVSLTHYDMCFSSLAGYEFRKETYIRDFNSDGNVYTLDDWGKLKFMLNGQLPKPIYKREKIVKEFKVFEKNNNKEDASEFLVVINNKTDLDRILNLATSYYYDMTNSLRNNNYFPIHVYFNFKTKIITHLGNELISLKYSDSLNKYDEFDGVWDKVLSINDFRLIDDILKNSEIKFTPTYTKREILKESINYKYSKIAVHLKTNEEVIKFQESIFDLGLGFRWITSTTPRVLFHDDTEMIVVLDLKTLKFLYYLDIEDYKYHNSNNINNDPKIYTYNDLYIIKNILLHGGEPTYKRKKVIRGFDEK